MVGLPGRLEDIFSGVDAMHERDGQTDEETDRRTDTGPQQRQRLAVKMNKQESK